jgi:hypothetical protein
MMVTDLPDYEKKVIVVTIPGEYPGLVDINHKQVGGVTLKTPSVSACLPISIEHTVLIDHRAILGEALKTPTFANCVPTSIENDAIAYDATNDRFYVDLAKISATDELAVKATDLDIRALLSTDIVTVKSITDALPAGSNAIGKLAANSGVDIGDVDVKTMPDVTQSDKTKLLATVTQAEKDRTVTGTLTQSTKHDAQTFLSARIDTATATTNVEVVAAQGEGKKIYVVGYQLQGKGDVEAVLRSANTDLSPEWDFNAREGVVAPICQYPAFYFVTATNEALNIYLDAAVRVTGNVQYVVGT